MWLRVLSWLGLRRFTREAAAAPPPAPAELNAAELNAAELNAAELNAAEVVMQASARSIQVAHAEGDVTVGPAFQGTHIHHHYYDRPPADMNAAPAAMVTAPLPVEPPPALSRTGKAAATPRQRQVLALLKRTGNEKGVLRWMEKTFGTGWVVALDEAQLQRVEQYCEAVIQNAQARERMVERKAQ